MPVSAGGMVMHSAVRAFLKKQPNIIGKYKSIMTSQDNNTLTLSENHLLYARTNCHDRFNPM